MKNFIHFFTYLFSVAVLVSCEPGRAENGDLLFGVRPVSGTGGGGTTVIKKLKSVTVDDGTDVVTYSYSYNSEGKLKKMVTNDGSADYELFYDANNSINKMTVIETKGALVATTNFAITYENGKFKEAMGEGSESDGSRFTNTYTAVYTNNKVSKISSKMVGIDSADPSVTHDVYTLISDLAYTGNNLSSWKSTTSFPPDTLPDLEINTTFDNYDARLNPFYLLPEVFNIITSHFETATYAVTGLSANNYGKVTVTANAGTQTADYTYTYDGDGYPTKATAPNLGTLTFQYQ